MILSCAWFCWACLQFSFFEHDLVRQTLSCCMYHASQIERVDNPVTVLVCDMHGGGPWCMRHVRDGALPDT